MNEKQKKVEKERRGVLELLLQKNDDCLRYLFSLTGKRLYISTLSVAQLISVYQERKSNAEITAVVRDLQHRFNIIVTNNYKDYRFLQGIEALRPAKVRKIPQ